ncbi:putative bifunctional diguanylate cyclase/phosphodiesterase [Anabaena sp. UHCC 0451]|uniref:putative bifunctional diguanylate cyclase/phosphodiesterase n=1 Tax=Anabaena sp. UHCC 0451 TaxID=2055235 RepID=UPI002B21DE9C|nr:EAL domain-containing protein [Anabaena sp. UHCC 0451]MEA5576485.1 EAL domain-containing protein [Anabaena sp. UHCC 0451]
MKSQLRILIVEDNLDDAELIVLELEAANYHVVYKQVDTAEAMTDALDFEEWDVILTDYFMPQFSAVAALDLFKQRKLDTPFIVVSGSIGEEIAVKLMRNGAHDYLLKHNLTRLAPVIERELREAKVRCERKQALEKVHFLAFYDQLTGLPNRHAFLNFLQKNIDNAVKFAVVFIDIDQYRQIKYGFGHLKSEQLLIELGKRLQTNLASGDFLARVGKDEFALILTNLNHVDEIATITTELHQLIDPPFDLEGFVIYASITIGIVDYRANFHEPEEFLRAAEIANYNAKEQGLQYPTVVYKHSMQTAALERLQMETELRRAISDQQLELFYQPIVDLNIYQAAGFEALIRWKHPQQGWISPATFIPLAEQTGLIIPLGESILKTACRQMTIWQDQFLDHLPLSLSVNISGVQLNEPDVVPHIIHQYQCLGLHHVTLKLEITESALMNNTQKIITCLQEFRAAGIQICIDDFGTGYSSLSYLRDLPIDILKIDRSFISRIEDEKNLGIVTAIITLANTLGLDVIAEGVETISQMQLLRSLGCKYGQGYLFSKAMPPYLIEDWLQKTKTEISFEQKLDYQITPQSVYC